MTHDNNAPKIRPVAKKLLDSLLFDCDLTPAVRVDFGIDSQAHFEALKEAVMSDQVTIQQLDEAMGNGAELTALVNNAGCNPEGIVFHTSWDVIYGRDQTEEPNIEPSEQAKPKHRQKQRQKNRRRNMEQER